MRSSFYLTLALGTMLAACGGASQPTMGSRLAAPQGDRARGIHYVIVKRATVPKNRCPSDQFAFCITISPESTGPYWGWCG
ncbi:MAG: hypothetical protein WBX23_11185, partial [Candidatus Cybelea sp.]